MIIFYNTCSFLLHTRDHFSDTGGRIDLQRVDISTIPMEMAGFLPIPKITRLYDTSDDSTDESLKISVKFFKPTDESVGKKYVNFIPNDLVFFSTQNGQNQAMVLKQVNEKIPKCLFIALGSTSDPKNDVEPVRHISDESPESHSNSGVESDDDVICLEDDDNDLNAANNSNNNHNVNIPKIQVKNIISLVEKKPFVSDPTSYPNCVEHSYTDKICPECSQAKIHSMEAHFQGPAAPYNDDFKCKICHLIASTSCSLQAHIRLHEKSRPYICPECAKGFSSWVALDNHMENTCFHLLKTTRFKCPAKKCGKIFAQSFTFNTHFPVAHMKVRISCSDCVKMFDSEIEYETHLNEHPDKVNDDMSMRIHECSVCILPVDDIKEHVKQHVHNKNNRIYVFICKYCRCYYRSKQTYALHMLKCAKLLLNSQVKKEVQRIESHNDMKCKVIKCCKPCNRLIEFHCTYKDIKRLIKICPKCLTPLTFRRSSPDCELEFTTDPYIRINSENNNLVCILCNETLRTFSFNKHPCQFKNPIVSLETIKISSDMISNLDYDNVVIEQSPPLSDDSSKKKRKRFSLCFPQKKRNSCEKSLEPPPAEPIHFDGEYKCNYCDFKSEDRKVFHEHIQEHRDISTSYQCMECGECFVVKPSLLKHLQVFHLIEDVESYINDNECFDKEAVRILEEHMHMLPGECKEVGENQCRICRLIFSDNQELSKHFRTHGMAFLMKKYVK